MSNTANSLVSDDQRRRIYLRSSKSLPKPTALRKLSQGLIGLGLGPLYVAAAHLAGAPGLRFRYRCAAVALGQFLRRSRLSTEELYKLLVFPMDSVRYFEFEFAWRSLAEISVIQYLDVSSPRMLPLLVIGGTPGINGRLLNPDVNDLKVTARYAATMNLSNRCAFMSSAIEDADIQTNSVDLLTCISVLEHIPRDTAAVAKMWSLVRPGGRMIITVPCAAAEFEEFVDDNKFGLLPADDEGFVFWQRYYDADLLEKRIFSLIGRPTRMQIFGEKVAGTYATNVLKKMKLGPLYAIWREPYMMAEDYRYFESVDALPGIGVIGLEFRKGNL